MPECCGRWFETYRAYEQHYDNSSAHNYQPEEVHECDSCDIRCSSEESLHIHCLNRHPYCASCRRTFRNDNNLMQHMHSKVHVGSSIPCPWCKTGFATASGVTIHLESGRCTKSGLDRQKLNTMIQQMDRRNVITKPMLTMANYDPPQATQRTWNGRAYECYFCDKEFSQLHGLNNHLKSPAHEQPLYHCPNPGCHKPYKVLSGLVQHLESESCGAIKFVNVQKQARNGIQNMVGRMIAN